MNLAIDLYLAKEIRHINEEIGKIEEGKYKHPEQAIKRLADNFYGNVFNLIQDQSSEKAKELENKIIYLKKDIQRK